MNLLVCVLKRINSVCLFFFFFTSFYYYYCFFFFFTRYPGLRCPKKVLPQNKPHITYYHAVDSNLGIKRRGSKKKNCVFLSANELLLPDTQDIMSVALKWHHSSLSRNFIFACILKLCQFKLQRLNCVLNYSSLQHL